MNWLQKQASSADLSKDIAIFENPDIRRELDGILTTTFSPRIWEILRATDYRVLPVDPEITTEHSYALVRKVRFLLFDYLDYPFLIGEFSVKQDSWMFDRTFSLALSQKTKPEILHTLIEDERFAGIPPTIHVEGSPSHPDWDMHFIVTFRAGSGTSWGSQVINDHAISTVKTVVDASLKMVNMAMNDKLGTKDDVKRFLDVAVVGFGAS